MMTEFPLEMPGILRPNRKERLKLMHTRKLLSLLRSNYGYDSAWHGDDDEEFIVFGFDQDREYSSDELRAELATREHIPNKAEARKIRQEKAKGSRPGRRNFLR